MLKNSIWLLATFLVLAFGIVDSNAKVIIKEKTQYYNVTGKTGKQVHSKLGRRGPWKMRRKHAIAATQRTFDFKNIKFSERGNKCVLTNVDVHLNLIYYYPRWINKKKASKKLQKLWASFSRELVRHEKTHGKYFKETMRQFERELLRIKGKRSNDCVGMADIARSRLDKAYKKGEAKHTAFDRREKRASSKVRKLEEAFVKAK